jgi:general secretion pathway protein G
LYDLRYLIRQYTVDLHRTPDSLDDLVVAGYLKEIPKDPMTGRNDTWTVERSRDPNLSGIINVHSGSNAVSRKGSAYRDW